MLVFWLLIGVKHLSFKLEIYFLYEVFFLPVHHKDLPMSKVTEGVWGFGEDSKVSILGRAAMQGGLFLVEFVFINERIFNVLFGQRQLHLVFHQFLRAAQIRILVEFGGVLLVFEERVLVLILTFLVLRLFFYGFFRLQPLLLPRDPHCCQLLDSYHLVDPCSLVQVKQQIFDGKLGKRLNKSFEVASHPLYIDLVQLHFASHVLQKRWILDIHRR
mmetsp:Transcript_5524/g.5049  ORF Transcript_5524/g.5049 Transcript_5524/m.5049 type:complete len:216 (+) Transcript_5524:945-1592(+)